MSLISIATALSIVISQTQAVNETNAARGVTLAPTSAALTNEATSLSVNPAALSLVGPGQLFYVHDIDALNNQRRNALFAAATLFDGLGLGLAFEWLRTQTGETFRKTAYGFSLGDKSLSLGLTFNNFSSDEAPDYNNFGSVDLGLSLRGFRKVSIGAVVRNIDNPSRGNLTLGRRYDFSLGLRPVGDNLSLGVDYLFDESRGFGAGRFAYTVQARLIRGLTLLGGVSHGLAQGDSFLFQVGATIDTSRLGVTYASGGTAFGNSQIIAARISAQDYPSISPSRGKIAVFNLESLLSGGGSPLATLFGGLPTDPYLRLTRLFEEASEDSELRGVVLTVNGLNLGLAKAVEMREAISRMQKKGKKVFAVVLSADDADYLAISSCDKILVTPGSVLQLDGLTASALFLGDAMEKLGVKWEVARVGAYKNAPDQFTRSSMSPEQRESINAYLDTDFRVYVQSVAQSRQITEDEFRKSLNEGLKSPSRAVDLKLADDVVDPQNIGDKVTSWLPHARFDPEYWPRSTRATRWGNRPKIAVIPIIGNIVNGRSRQGPSGLPESAGSATVVRAIKQAAADPSIEAIVLRIDSGGGDTLASDLMYRAVLEAKKKKPVIASMGDVAASGGYYAAMGAQMVFAQSTTITGSIGVFFVKPAVKELADKLGVHNETIRRGDLAGMLSTFDPWTPAERDAAQKWVDSFYDTFISEVASCRGLTKDKVDAVARGRVWAGDDALKHNLVDRVGGLQDAIAFAKEKGRIAATEEIDIVILDEASERTADPGATIAQALVQASPPSPVQPWLDLLQVKVPTEPISGLQSRMEFNLSVQ